MQKEPSAQGSGEKKKFSIRRRWMVFGVIYLLAAMLIACVVNSKHLGDFLSLNLTALRPVLIGLLIAYIANPIFKFLHDNIFTWENRAQAVRKTLSMVVAYAVILLFVTAFVMLILPQVTASINDLTNNFNDYMETTFAYINELLDKLPFEIADISLDTVMVKIFETDQYGQVNKPDVKLILEQYGAMGAELVVNLVGIALDILIGLFIAAYTLASKQRIAAQIRRILTALFHEKGCKAILSFTREVDKTFGRYVVGKLTDSMLVIVVACIAFSLFKLPYAVLIGFIVGFTNIIPFFGPILGAIPCGLLVFIAEPRKLITFIILVLVIQQIDANIIDPLITGNATGISSLGVIVAVTVMGNYFGILGMFIGVPVTVSLLNLGKKLLDRKLIAGGLPTDLDPYYPSKTEEVDKTSGEHIPFITATVRRINSIYHGYQERKKRATEKKDAKRAANAEKKAKSDAVKNGAPKEQTCKPDIESAATEETAESREKETVGSETDDGNRP